MEMSIMLFKRFDVSHTHVLIDEDVIPRPAYIGSSQWIEFWQEASDAQDRGGWQAGFDAGFEEGKMEAAEDNKEEIASIELEHERELSKLEGQLNDIEEEAYARGHRDGIIDGRLDSSL